MLVNEETCGEEGDFSQDYPVYHEEVRKKRLAFFERQDIDQLDLEEKEDAIDEELRQQSMLENVRDDLDMIFDVDDGNFKEKHSEPPSDIAARLLLPRSPLDSSNRDSRMALLEQNVPRYLSQASEANKSPYVFANISSEDTDINRTDIDAKSSSFCDDNDYLDDFDHNCYYDNESDIDLKYHLYDASDFELPENQPENQERYSKRYLVDADEVRERLLQRSSSDLSKYRSSPSSSEDLNEDSKVLVPPANAQIDDVRARLQERQESSLPGWEMSNGAKLMESVDENHENSVESMKSRIDNIREKLKQRKQDENADATPNITHESQIENIKEKLQQKSSRTYLDKENYSKFISEKLVEPKLDDEDKVGRAQNGSNVNDSIIEDECKQVFVHSEEAPILLGTLQDGMEIKKGGYVVEDKIGVEALPEIQSSPFAALLGIETDQGFSDKENGSVERNDDCSDFKNKDRVHESFSEERLTDRQEMNIDVLQSDVCRIEQDDAEYQNDPQLSELLDYGNSLEACLGLNDLSEKYVMLFLEEEEISEHTSSAISHSEDALEASALLIEHDDPIDANPAFMVHSRPPLSSIDRSMEESIEVLDMIDKFESEIEMSDGLEEFDKSANSDAKRDFFGSNMRYALDNGSQDSSLNSKELTVDTSKITQEDCPGKGKVVDNFFGEIDTSIGGHATSDSTVDTDSDYSNSSTGSILRSPLTKASKPLIVETGKNDDKIDIDTLDWIDASEELHQADGSDTLADSELMGDSDVSNAFRVTANSHKIEDSGYLDRKYKDDANIDAEAKLMQEPIDRALQHDFAFADSDLNVESGRCQTNVLLNGGNIENIESKEFAAGTDAQCYSVNGLLGNRGIEGGEGSTQNEASEIASLQESIDSINQLAVADKKGKTVSYFIDEEVAQDHHALMMSTKDLDKPPLTDSLEDDIKAADFGNEDFESSESENIESIDSQDMSNELLVVSLGSAAELDETLEIVDSGLCRENSFVNKAVIVELSHENVENEGLPVKLGSAGDLREEYRARADLQNLPEELLENLPLNLSRSFGFESVTLQSSLLGETSGSDTLSDFGMSDSEDEIEFGPNSTPDENSVKDDEESVKLQNFTQTTNFSDANVVHYLQPVDNHVDFIHSSTKDSLDTYPFANIAEMDKKHDEFGTNFSNDWFESARSEMNYISSHLDSSALQDDNNIDTEVKKHLVDSIIAEGSIIDSTVTDFPRDLAISPEVNEEIRTVAHGDKRINNMQRALSEDSSAEDLKEFEELEILLQNEDLMEASSELKPSYEIHSYFKAGEEEYAMENFSYNQIDGGNSFPGYEDPVAFSSNIRPLKPSEQQIINFLDDILEEEEMMESNVMEVDFDDFADGGAIGKISVGFIENDAAAIKELNDMEEEEQKSIITSIDGTKEWEKDTENSEMGEFHVEETNEVPIEKSLLMDANEQFSDSSEEHELEVPSISASCDVSKDVDFNEKLIGRASSQILPEEEGTIVLEHGKLIWKAIEKETLSILDSCQDEALNNIDNSTRGDIQTTGKGGSQVRDFFYFMSLFHAYDQN